MAFQDHLDFKELPETKVQVEVQVLWVSQVSLVYLEELVPRGLLAPEEARVFLEVQETQVRIFKSYMLILKRPIINTTC